MSHFPSIDCICSVCTKRQANLTQPQRARARQIESNALRDYRKANKLSGTRILLTQGETEAKRKAYEDFMLDIEQPIDVLLDFM